MKKESSKKYYRFTIVMTDEEAQQLFNASAKVKILPAKYAKKVVMEHLNRLKGKENKDVNL